MKSPFCPLPSALCPVSGVARRAGASPRPGRRGSPRATRSRAVQEPRAGQQRRHQGEAAARAGNAALQRRLPDGARGSPRPLGAVRNHHDRRRRVLRSPRHARPRRHDRVADGRRHDDEELRADRAGARHDGRYSRGVGECGIADCDRDRLGAHGSIRRRARAGVRRAAESELSGKGNRPVQGARPRRARRTAQRSQLPEAGALLEGGLRRPSGVERRADARVAREDDARYARELPQEQLRARSRHHRRVRRHHPCRSADEIRSGAQELGKERETAARRHRSA